MPSGLLAVNSLQRYLHEHGEVVGVGDVLGVVGDAFQALVVEDVVDAYRLLEFAVGVHYDMYLVPVIKKIE